MKKQKKKRNRKQQNRRKKNHPRSNVVKMTSRKRQTGELGLFERDYPPMSERRRIISRLQEKTEQARSSDDWWQLGEFLVYDGLMDENDVLVNEGIEALTRGADHPEPNSACMLDLAWILMFRRLDAMALPHLKRAVELAPKSRDAWALLGLCHIGKSNRDLAIEAYQCALKLPQATDTDREVLAKLQTGDDLKKIRSNTILRKIPLEKTGCGGYSTQEAAKIACHNLKPLLEAEPNNQELVYHLAVARYTLHQFDQARMHLSHLQDLSGGDARAYTMQGLIAKKQHNDRQAEKDCYAKALEVDPDFLLAMVNLASIMQDEGNYHSARPILEHALNGDQNDRDYALALDLYGNNIGVIDEDFEAEAQYHKRAMLLDPGKSVYKYNFITSLLFSGKGKDARSLFQENKQSLRKMPNYEMLSGLVEAYTRDLGHPNHYLELITQIVKPLYDFKAAAPLIEKAWAQRAQLLRDSDMTVFDRVVFYEDIGTYADHARLHELAVKIWQEGSLLPGLPEEEGFDANHARALSDLGRHAEALEIADNMPMITGQRRYTMLGNIRNNAQQELAAIQAYRQALEKDETFLLPISNAVDCINRIRRPDLLPPFIEALEQHWQDDRKTLSLHAHSYLMAGYPGKAADLFGDFLIKDDRVLAPEEVAGEQDNDLTILGNISADDHKAYAKALIFSRREENFVLLLHDVEQWPDWQDGDWKVLLAEFHRRRGKIEFAESVLTDMPSHPPIDISRALCHLDRDQFSEARKCAEKALSVSRGAGKFNHIEGRPDAVATAIIALTMLEDGQLDLAVKKAQNAVSLDIGCPIARKAYALALWTHGEQAKAIEILLEGLKRAPGRPQVVQMAVEKLCEIGHIDKADDLLENQRPLIAEFNVAGLVERLTATIAKARQEKRPSLEEILQNVNIEGREVELKSSFQCDVHGNVSLRKKLIFSCLKTVAAFMNTNGGTLLIGVDDEGEILGLKPDLKLAQGTPDGFERAFMEKLGNAIGKDSASLYCSLRFEMRDEKTVCLVDVQRAKEPVFLEYKMSWKENQRAEKREFYFARYGGATMPLHDKEKTSHIRKNFLPRQKQLAAVPVQSFAVRVPERQGRRGLRVELTNGRFIQPGRE